MEAMAVIKSSGVENLNPYSQFLVYKNLIENRTFIATYGEYLKRSGEILEQEKSFFTIYAQFIRLKNGTTAEDKNNLREFLDINMPNSSEFIPFMLAKGDLN